MACKGLPGPLPGPLRPKPLLPNPWNGQAAYLEGRVLLAARRETAWSMWLAECGDEGGR